MKSKVFLFAEFLICFVILPISLALPYPLWIKMALTVLGFIYVLWVLKSQEGISFVIKKQLDWKRFWKRIMFTFSLVAISTIIFVWLTDKGQLFYVPRKHPLLFFFILLVYTLVSAWPQEILYRTFFYKRYKLIFSNKYFMVIINAIIFSLAHLFFKNGLVLLVTFIGGVIFSLTYLKFKSTALVTIEHALYGNWLFTVGMGQMLDFPGFDN